jgi:HEAT repeat protein
VSHPLLAQLKSPDPSLRRDACLAAAADPAAVLLVDALVPALGDPVRAVWRAASDALVAIARRDPGVWPALRGALSSPDAPTRRAAALAGARIAPRELRLLPPLVDALGSDDRYVRWGAARALVELGQTQGEVHPLVLHLAQTDPNPVARRMAAFCLRDLAPDDPRTAAALLDASRDSDLRVHRAALSALASLLAPPREVEERLRDALESDPDAASRRIATAVLRTLGTSHTDFVGERTRAALASARDSSPDPDLRRAAERTLEELREKPRDLRTGPRPT